MNSHLDSGQYLYKESDEIHLPDCLIPALKTNNMKFLVVLAVAVACASADVSHVVGPDYQVPIVRSNFESNPDGSGFQYAYETGNGIVSQADGVVKNPNSENAALEVKGNVRYTAPDGTPVELSYVANEGGYVATGSHVPKVPELILRAQEYIASHPPAVKKV